MRAFGKSKGAGPRNPTNIAYDVVVYGGTIAGINAAWTARLLGAKVALVEPTANLGGVTGSGGLTNIDIWYLGHIGGIFWQQFQQMAVIEGSQSGFNQLWPTTSAASSTSTNLGYINNAIPGPLTPQPKTAAQVLNKFAFASGADLYFNAPLQTIGGSVYPSVIMSGSAITAINTSAGPISGKCFIDASYEGDILAAVASQGQATYTIGRESSSQYSESYAGVSPGTATVLGGGVSLVDGNSNPLFPIVSNPSLTTGAADSAVQPANFRACIQKISNGGVAFTSPAGYSAANYTLVGRGLTGQGATTFAAAAALNQLEGNKYCLNDVSGSLPYAAYNQANGYGDGTPSQRTAIIASVKSYYQGLLYFLANDASVPAAVRADAATYGLAGDEFRDNGNWPYQMYIREGRRMVGSYVMKQSDCVTGTTQTHPICKGSYILDCHAPLIYLSDSTHYVVDGLVDDSTYGPYQIPMECIIPQAGQCTNLIVPVCVSASHVAWMSMRMESSFAMMGEAAGIMAAKVASLSKTVQNLSYITDILPSLTTNNVKLS